MADLEDLRTSPHSAFIRSQMEGKVFVGSTEKEKIGMETKIL